MHQRHNLNIIQHYYQLLPKSLQVIFQFQYPFQVHRRSLFGLGSVRSIWNSKFYLKTILDCPQSFLDVLKYYPFYYQFQPRPFIDWSIKHDGLLGNRWKQSSNITKIQKKICNFLSSYSIVITLWFNRFFLLIKIHQFCFKIRINLIYSVKVYKITLYQIFRD